MNSWAMGKKGIVPQQQFDVAESVPRQMIIMN